MIRLIMIGAGGHALSVADSLDRTAVELVGCINEVNDLTLPGIPLSGRSLEEIPGAEEYCYFIAIGDNDEDILAAVRELERTHGGYTIVEHGEVFDTLELPVMGLISDRSYSYVSKKVGA